MSQELLDGYIRHQKEEGEKFKKLIRNRFLFRLFLLAKLPMAWLAGVRVQSFTEDQTEVSLRYRWINQNPFRSTYFAALSMAAEMSSGLTAMYYTRNAKPRISMLVTRMEAEFTKKATGRTTFTFRDGDKIRQAVHQAILSGEPQTVKCKAIGQSESGEEEAVFYITWSFKSK